MIEWPATRYRARRALKWLWIVVVWATGLLALAKWRIRRRGSIIVLTFHRVLPDDKWSCTGSVPDILVREHSFDHLLEHICRYYEPLDLTGEITFHKSNRLRFAVTFDDGWIDCARVAAPIARRRRVPLTVFICPSRMALALPFWPEQRVRFQQQTGKPAASGAIVAAERASKIGEADFICTQPTQRYPDEIDSTMSWEDVTRLDRQRVVFGSHTSHHEILDRIPRGQAQSELCDSKRIIEERLGKKCQLFAYPNGDWSPDARILVSSAGYRFAFINDPGVWTSDSDCLLIPRVNICEADLIGLQGRFSRLAFEFAAIWKAFRHGSGPTVGEV